LIGDQRRRRDATHINSVFCGASKRGVMKKKRKRKGGRISKANKGGKSVDEPGETSGLDDAGK